MSLDQDSALKIMEAIGDAKSELQKDFGVLATTVGTFHGNIDARVKAVEGEIQTQKKHQFIVTYIVLPILSAAHAIAAHFGVKV